MVVRSYGGSIGLLHVTMGFHGVCSGLLTESLSKYKGPPSRSLVSPAFSWRSRR